MSDASRRPLKSRSSVWAGCLAGWLARRKTSPNAISLLSVVFALMGTAALAGLCYLTTPWVQSALLISAAACVQLRLVCNLIDGMVAVEGGLSSATGSLFNEIPDRFADILFLVGTGYAAACSAWPFAMELGWLAASLSVLTAYVRTLGAAVGTGHSFLGPMAKPHRMFVLTVACIIAAGMAATQVAFWPHVLWIALVIINGGMVITLWRRIQFIARSLQAKQAT